MAENNDENKQTLREYLLYKATTINAKGKLQDIERYIGRFLDFTKKPIEQYTQLDLVNFLNSLKNMSQNSQNDIKVMLKNFLKWKFVDYSLRFRDLDKLCKNQKAQPTYTPEDMLSKEEVEKLIQEEMEFKWKAYWGALFYGGFRPCELSKLEWKNVLFENDGGAFIKIYSNKNKRYFDKYIPQPVAFWFKKIQENGSEFVFPSTKTARGKAPIGVKTAYFRLVKLSKKALGKSVNPYQIRHSIATLLYNRDDIKDEDVARQMGHNKTMRQTYDQLDAQKIREKLKKIYIKTEILPQEQKNEYEARIAKLEKAINLLLDKKGFTMSTGKIAMKNFTGIHSVDETTHLLETDESI